MEQRGQHGLNVKQWISMEQRKAYSVKLETGIATPELAIRKHHPLENDLQNQDSTAASSPWQDSRDTPLPRTRQQNYIRKARHHDHLYDMRCVKLLPKFPCTSEKMLGTLMSQMIHVTLFYSFPWFRSTKLPSFSHTSDQYQKRVTSRLFWSRQGLRNALSGNGHWALWWMRHSSPPSKYKQALSHTTMHRSTRAAGVYVPDQNTRCIYALRIKGLNVASGRLLSR